MSKSRSSGATPERAAGPFRGRWGKGSALLVLAVAVILLSLFSGSAEIGMRRVLGVLLGSADNAARSIVLDLRVPRLIAAFAVGSLLALAGVLLQALFRNPLADPYVLGVSGGAAVGAVIALSLGAAQLLVQSSAAAGAFVIMILVYALGRGGGTTRLLLIGVALASTCGALVMVLLTAADATRVRGIVFWLAGDLGWVVNPVPTALAAIVGIAGIVLLARPLNVLAAGELRARSVGLDFELWRLVVYVAAALTTAIAVVSAGTVGFIGLVTPHAVRLLFRTSDHRVVAPASALLGGAVLAAADLCARTIASPRQLPVGAITALVGAPAFVLLLRARAK